MKIVCNISLLFLFFLSLNATSQSGKVFLNAQIEADNQNADMQISVIDLATKNVIQRNEVSTRFFSELTTNSRYLVYFKKAEHPAMRLIVDTHTNLVANYSVHFSLNLKNLNKSFETGISISAGTLKFDDGSGRFVFQPSMSPNCDRVAITASGFENELAAF